MARNVLDLYLHRGSFETVLAPLLTFTSRYKVL
jgi:hypothetical protein